MELEISHITKIINNRKILDDISFSLSDGICAMLGPNGAGKTTLISLIAGLSKPSAGNILFSDSESMRNHIGFMPQQETVYPEFTAMEFLEYIAMVKGLKRSAFEGQIAELLRAVDLWEERGKRIRHMSGGMKQRLRIAQALLGDPDLIILDEPTAGLDPEQRVAVRNLLSAKRKGNITIFATHVVSDIEFIASTILILNKGKVAACDVRQKMLEDMRGQVFILRTDTDRTENLKKDYILSDISPGVDGYYSRIILDKKDAPCGAREVPPSIEDVYLKIIHASS